MSCKPHTQASDPCRLAVTTFQCLATHYSVVVGNSCHMKHVESTLARLLINYLQAIMLTTICIFIQSIIAEL